LKSKDEVIKIACKTTDHVKSMNENFMNIDKRSWIF